MSFLYHTFFFDPLYNLLVLLAISLPWAGAGIIVILLTLFVRFLTYPLSKKAIVTQQKMAELAPRLAEIKEKYKNSEEQAKKTLELYREAKVNPFAGILVIIIQIPIVIALYQIFLHAGFPKVDPANLYSFVRAPEFIEPVFLGIDLSTKSAILAFIAALTMFIQLRLSLRNQPKPKGDTFSDNLTRSMHLQMKYFFPVLVFFIAYKISGVIALYWLTTNLFSIGQELFLKRKFANRA